VLPNQISKLFEIFKNGFYDKFFLKIGFCVGSVDWLVDRSSAVVLHYCWSTDRSSVCAHFKCARCRATDRSTDNGLKCFGQTSVDRPINRKIFLYHCSLLRLDNQPADSYFWNLDSRSTDQSTDVLSVTVRASFFKICFVLFFSNGYICSWVYSPY